MHVGASEFIKVETIRGRCDDPDFLPFLQHLVVTHAKELGLC